MIVLGGGAIDVELAQVFARFRSAVTMVEGQYWLQSQEELEAGELAGKVLREDGVTVLTSARAQDVSHDGTGFIVHIEGKKESRRADRLLVATGRRAGQGPCPRTGRCEPAKTYDVLDVWKARAQAA